MLNVVICDDSLVFLEHAKSIVARELAAWDAEIECFQNAEELLKSLSCGDYLPDIALLDVEMEGLDGISLARRLNQKVPNCAIIFMTAYLRYASAVYEAEHVWLVVKSEMESYLPQALKKSLNVCHAEELHKQRLLVRSGRSTVVLSLEDVLYIERFHYKTKLVLDYEKVVETTQLPAEILVGKGTDFVRCHQGYWINMKHVVELVHNEFVLCNGERIAISRTYRDKSREAFFARFK